VIGFGGTGFRQLLTRRPKAHLLRVSIVMVSNVTYFLGLAALLVLASAVCYAGSHMMTRRMRDTESAMTLNFFVQIGFVAVSLTMGLVAGDGRFAGSGDPSLEFLLRPWVWPPVGDWWAFAATGVAVGIGGMMISQAYRTTEAALIAPFEYIGMPMAIFWGVVVFGTFPDVTGWIGIALICGAGLYTLARETLRRKDVDVAAPSGDL
jgi:drug/metabolite transporter (DMT)-like permease